MANTYFAGKDRAAAEPGFGIYVDQAGYRTESRKIAAIPFPAEIFALVDENGNKVYEGIVSHFGTDAISGDDVYVADFSAFTKSGSYRVAAGDRKSALFRIGDGVYNHLFADSLKAFYYFRCGMELEEKYAGAYAHKACHCGKAVIFGGTETTDADGGWHDAGDYGKYVIPGACACAQLLYAYKLFPGSFDKLDLNIPESGSGLPDILSECRYELEWLLKMQREDGAVWHKATTMQHAPFVMPEDDPGNMYVFPVSSSATADFCAVSALAAGIYRPFDTVFSERLERSAGLAYEWLSKNRGFIGFDNPEGCNTGIYGEQSDTDNRYWAAAEMFALTNERRYNDDFVKLSRSSFFLGMDHLRTALGYSNIGGLGSLAYVLHESPDRDEQIAGDLKSLFVGEAYWHRDKANKNGYCASMEEWEYYWGSNMVLLQHAMVLILGGMFSDYEKFYEYAEEQLHVLLGRNALGISYVTGNGEYACRNPHYRPSEADGIEASVPGLVIGGPNRNLNDEFAKQFIPGNTPPMKCFTDDFRCYSLNEVTIYWNSPLVFVLAFLAQK